MLRKINRACGFTEDLQQSSTSELAAATPAATVSVVTACMNRNENLVAALKTWLEFSEIGEIIIVDWSSQIDVRDSIEVAGLADERITILRVEKEARWILSWAYNLGFTYVSNAKVLKLDADILLDSRFFELNKLSPQQFCAGDWRMAESGQEHINGAFYCHTNDLLKAGGFNEYIQSYGWDDDDLYSRLINFGLHRELIPPESVHHIDHDDTARIETTSKVHPTSLSEAFERSTDIQIRFNEKLTGMLPPWSGNKARREYVTLEEAGPNFKKLLGRSSSSLAVPAYFYKAAKIATAYQLISWKLGPAVLDFEPELVENAMTRQLVDDMTLESIAGTVKSNKTSRVSRKNKKLFIDAQHGLGNRLRAVASAAAIAEATNRQLVVVWQPDDHCEGVFSDLFSSPFEVIDCRPCESELEHTDFYNYMEAESGSSKDELIQLDTDKDVYVRSAYVVNHAASNWKAENRQIKKLKISKDVLDLVNSVEVGGLLGAHVRMVGGAQYEHLSYEADANWTKDDQELIGKWRAASHYSNFFAKIDSMLEQKKIDRIFVAADLPETYEAFLDRYPKKVCHLERGLFDRSAEQLKYALADALLLSKHSHLLGSSWSSFTELATRLSSNSPIVELSGVDF